MIKCIDVDDNVMRKIFTKNILLNEKFFTKNILLNELFFTKLIHDDDNDDDSINL